MINISVSKIKEIHDRSVEYDFDFLKYDYNKALAVVSNLECYFLNKNHIVKNKELIVLIITLMVNNKRSLATQVLASINSEGLQKKDAEELYNFALSLGKIIDIKVVIYLFLLFDSSYFDEYLVKYCKEITNNIKDPTALYAVHSLSFPSNIARCNEKGIPVFKKVDVLRRLYKIARSAFVNVEYENNFLLESKFLQGKVRKILYIVGKPFPSEKNTHASFISRHVLITNDLSIQNYLMITGESSFDTPWGGVFPLNNKYIDINKKFSKKLNVEDENFFSPNVSEFLDDSSLIQILNYVGSVKPDIIAYIGGVYESRVLRKILYPYYPTLVLPTTTNVNNHLGCPDEYFDLIWARSDNHQIDLSKKIKSSRLFRLTMPFYESDDEGNTNAVPEFKIPDGRLVYSVLGGGRLGKTISNLSSDFKDKICQILNEHPDVFWLLVGEDYESAVKSLSNDDDLLKLIESKKIIPCGKINDLRAFYKFCYCVFTLPHTGGGGALMQAVYDNIPVICPSINDVASKIPHTAQYDNFNNGLDILSAILSDRSERDCFVREIIDLKRQHSYSDVLVNYSAMLESVVLNYSLRLS